MKYRSLKHWKYELLEEMKCYVDIAGVSAAENEYIRIRMSDVGDRRMVLTIYPRYAWDGPSGPTIDTKTFMRGSLFHDALCQLIGEGLLDKKYRKYADQLLRKLCLEDGMSKFRVWYVYQSSDYTVGSKECDMIREKEDHICWRCGLCCQGRGDLAFDCDDAEDEYEPDDCPALTFNNGVAVCKVQDCKREYCRDYPFLFPKSTDPRDFMCERELKQAGLWQGYISNSHPTHWQPA